MNNLITEVDRKKIVARLNERGIKKCPMCAKGNFSLVDGFFHIHIQKGVKLGGAVSGTFIPSIAIICTNCGHTSQHALGSLGLLEEFKSKYQS